MTVATRKFNPGFLTEDELLASFCVRTHEFESILEILRGCTGNSSQHQIVIGPRGSGKTTLLLRVAAEIARVAELSQTFFPVRFAEESYEVSTAGEFWLESLAQLVEQVPQTEDGHDLNRALEELRTVQDDRLLAERCLAVLLDYSDSSGKRLVLLVENLNMMFHDMLDRDAGWRLRHTLQTEPRIVLLASATSRFEEITNRDNALYDQLQEHYLKPLDTRECVKLWETLSGESTSEERVRPLEILTGGSPRLLAILARFGAGKSLADLMDQLLDLVDDNTEYFKSHIEALPSQERRVYLALADLWKPATTKEIAERARITTNKCSAQLRRLTGRGAVRLAGGSATRKQYYLAERLYNIYYLLRRNRGPERVVRALLQFMASYYAPLDLLRIASSFVLSTITVEDEADHQIPLKHTLLEQLPLLAELPPGWQTTPDRHAVLKFTTFFGRFSRYFKQGRLEDALAATEKILAELLQMELGQEDTTVPLAFGLQGKLLSSLERPEEAVLACSKALDSIGPESALPSAFIASTLHLESSSLHKLGRSEEALEVLSELDRRVPSDEDLGAALETASALFRRVKILEELGRLSEAAAECDVIVRRYENADSPELEDRVARALVEKGKLLEWSDKHDEALEAIDEARSRLEASGVPSSDRRLAMTLLARGYILRTLDRADEAREAYVLVCSNLSVEEPSATRVLLTNAQLELASLELDSGDYGGACRLAGEVLAHDYEGSADDHARAHLIRLWAVLLDGTDDPERDLVAALNLIPAVDSLPLEGPSALLCAAVRLGVGRLLRLIDASPSGELLLPLKVALEQELGRSPRVAQEVEEVAKDIRRDLAELRRHVGPVGQKPSSDPDEAS